VSDMLQTALGKRNATLAAAGVDLWHPLEDVPQQLRAGRYTAMAHYYDSIGPWGAVMMRHTASLQVNLDLGPEGVWQERWALANLMSPLVTATFACSPGEAGVCTRAHAWQNLDPSRTGFTAGLVHGSDDDPRMQWAYAALDANVMLIRSEDGGAHPCEPGSSFIGWIEHGHPELGWPTRDDLDYHLTTLFFEVRPRGFLELRAGEALPGRWRAALVVLMTAALYDDRARTHALELLDGLQHRLPSMWRRASVEGVRDPELADLAGRVWGAALEGAHRLPLEYFGRTALAVAHEFLERFTYQGRMPADELGALQAQDPALALRWASLGDASARPAE
jgi:glutamate--cysteine ligase